MDAPKWIWEEEEYGHGYGSWKCSVCRAPNRNIGGNKGIDPLLFVGSKFCPNCGKQMDGKATEEPQNNEIGGDTMEKLSTVQQLGKLNEVFRAGEEGPGGAYHTYVIARAERSGSDNPIIATIKFQKGPRNAPDGRTGILDSDLIEIVRDRLKSFQNGEYATKENATALGYLEAALTAMNERVEDRIKRGVLGTDKK